MVARKVDEETREKIRKYLRGSRGTSWTYGR
jgi:hypothetical protein